MSDIRDEEELVQGLYESIKDIIKTIRMNPERNIRDHHKLGSTIIKHPLYEEKKYSKGNRALLKRLGDMFDPKIESLCYRAIRFAKNFTDIDDFCHRAKSSEELNKHLDSEGTELTWSFIRENIPYLKKVLYNIVDEKKVSDKPKNRDYKQVPISKEVYDELIKQYSRDKERLGNISLKQYIDTQLLHKFNDSSYIQIYQERLHNIYFMILSQENEQYLDELVRYMDYLAIEERQQQLKALLSTWVKVFLTNCSEKKVEQ